MLNAQCWTWAYVVAGHVVSVHYMARHDLPHTLSLVCTPMYTFCYNTYIRLYTLSYLISASLQDVTDIVADVCMHAAESNTNGCQFVLEEAHCRMFWCRSSVGLYV